MYMDGTQQKRSALNSQWIGTAISAVGSLAGSLLGSGANANMNFRTRQWQSREREASQAFQDQQRIAQNQFAEDMYNKYDSPQAQVDQLIEAGLNPRLAAGNPQSVGATSGSSGGAPSAPGAPSPPYMPYNSLSTGFQDIAGSLKSLADAKKTGIDTELVEKTLDSQVRAMNADADLKEFMNSLNKRYMPSKMFGEVQKLFQDVKNGQATFEQIKATVHNLEQDGYIKENEVRTWQEKFDMDMYVAKADAALKHANAALSNEQRKLVGPQIAQLAASTAREYATARKLNVESDQILRFQDVVFDTLVTELKTKDYNSILASLQAGAQAIKNKNLELFGKEETPESVGTALIDYMGASKAYYDNEPAREAKFYRSNDEHSANSRDYSKYREDYDNSKKSK